LRARCQFPELAHSTLSRSPCSHFENPNFDLRTGLRSTRIRKWQAKTLSTIPNRNRNFQTAKLGRPRSKDGRFNSISGNPRFNSIALDSNHLAGVNPLGPSDSKFRRWRAWSKSPGPLFTSKSRPEMLGGIFWDRSNTRGHERLEEGLRIKNPAVGAAGVLKRPVSKGLNPTGPD
jgi:hypothetical protein